MAITKTARFGLTRPGADTDAFQRSDWVASLDAIESKAAMYVQVKTFNDRPPAAWPGRLCAVTDTGIVYYDTGSTWVQVVPDPLVTTKYGMTATGNLTGSMGIVVRAGIVTVSANLVAVASPAGGQGVRQMTATLPAGVPKPVNTNDGLFNLVPSNGSIVPPGRGWVHTTGDVSWYTSSATALTSNGSYLIQTTYVGA